jgi:hypothetical protein
MLNRRKNYFCQLLNVHGAGGVRQAEMHTAEPFVPELSASEAEVAIGNLKDINCQVLSNSGRTDSNRREKAAF